MMREYNIFNGMKEVSVKIVIIFTVSFFGIISGAMAQSLYIEPNSGQYAVDNAFPVKIYLESAGEAVNAAQAIINFPADFLEVKSISKNGSVFTFWPVEPAFSNAEGRINFSGGVPAPGVTGIGKILTVNFKVKKEGEITLSLSDEMLLKADGRGTNVLGNSGDSSYKANYKLIVKDGNISTESNNSVPAGFSFKPEIYSLSHPDQNQWYKDPNIKINWKISESVSGVSVKMDKNNFSDPDLASQGLFNFKVYDNTKDGIWYFHLKAENQAGWSKTFNYKVQIDTVDPEPFNIKIDNYGDLTSPQPSLYFETKDILSGIENYEVKIDDKNTIMAGPGKTNPLVLPIQFPGMHKVSVLALDHAGNKTESRAEFEIKSIEIPDILIYTKAYNAGEEIFYLEGTSAPNSKVSIFFTGTGRTKIWQTLSDSKGNWSFLTDELFKSGTYELYARSEDKRGAVSSPSPKKDVEVVLNGVSIGFFLVTYYNLLLIIVAFILLITILTVYIYKKSEEEKIKIKKEVHEARLSLEITFKNLRKKIIKKIEYFDEKPGLSPEEKKIRDSIMGILNSSEKIVEKEIKDIEKEIN